MKKKILFISVCLSATVALFLIPTSSVLAIDPLFDTAINYNVGDNPRSVCVGDLDGDNDLDLAVANCNTDNISVILNNGDGTYAAAVNYSAGDCLYSVCAGDMDGDNDLDLVVANAISDNISVLLNNGDGTYASAVNYSAGDYPLSVCAGDLDGDNDLDLAVANRFDDNVSVLLNNGDGTYAAAVNYSAGEDPYSVCAGDMDGDNHLDLAVANATSGNISVLLNNGDGTYTAAVNYSAGNCPYSVCAGDMDGDNDLDLAVANAISDNISVLLNNGDGTYTAAVNYSAGDGPHSVCAGDLDGDNNLDLAVANLYSDNVSVLLNNGDGTYASAVNYSAGDGPHSVCAGDFDGDNNLDLAVANLHSDNVSVLLSALNCTINSISDIPNDQGRRVRILWDNCYHDNIETSIPITEYAVYRKIDYNLSASQEACRSKDNDEFNKDENNRQMLFYPPGDWDHVVSVPACAEQEYSKIVTTLADSTIFEGMYYSTFFIRALTPTPGVHFDSHPDSGYSVDNLAPGVPGGFSVAYNTGSGNELGWVECEDVDFQYFRIYRSDNEGFEPDIGNLIHSTADTQWQDSDGEGWKYYYKITAIDHGGNESDPAAPDVTTGTEMQNVSATFALHQNYPNPFNPSTIISFVLPEPGKIKLSVYDIEGKLVNILLDKALDGGFKEVAWGGKNYRGNPVSSGVYFYRLKAGGKMLTKKMVLLK